MGGVGIVEVINSRGCSRLFVAAPGSLPPASLPSLSSPRSSSLMTPSSVAVSGAGTEFQGSSLAGPFSGLVICVTGLSKEVRKQVMDATERLGGRYSASLHHQCTHLVVQSFGGRKFEYALKHGLKNGLSVVTLGWFIDSIRRSVRMNESLYAVKNVGENGFSLQEMNHRDASKSCIPIHEDSKISSVAWQSHLQKSEKEVIWNSGSPLANKIIYIDTSVSNDLKKKVADAALKEGAIITDQWCFGCRASHVVCEGPHIHKYIGHAHNLVTPLWILKSVKENYAPRLVTLSSDLARHVAISLENVQMSLTEQDANGQNALQTSSCMKESPVFQNKIKSLEVRQKIVEMAKMGVRNRRSHHLQSCNNAIGPIRPRSILDSVCWSVSESSSSAGIYLDCHETGDGDETRVPSFFNDPSDKKNLDLDVSFSNFSRPLKESEKLEMVFKHHFLTILFPIDRFGELGPSSRTFFREGGFTCLQVLEHIYNFYQEKMTAEEVDVAIHTDSKHADALRSLYAGKGTANRSSIQFKRIDFLGSRRSFEVLKRLNGENNCNLYELIIRA